MKGINKMIFLLAKKTWLCTIFNIILIFIFLKSYVAEALYHREGISESCSTLERLLHPNIVFIENLQQFLTAEYDSATTSSSHPDYRDAGPSSNTADMTLVDSSNIVTPTTQAYPFLPPGIALISIYPTYIRSLIWVIQKYISLGATREVSLMENILLNTVFENPTQAEVKEVLDILRSGMLRHGTIYTAMLLLILLNRKRVSYAIQMPPTMNIALLKLGSGPRDLRTKVLEKSLKFAFDSLRRYLNPTTSVAPVAYMIKLVVPYIISFSHNFDHDLADFLPLVSLCRQERKLFLFLDSAFHGVNSSESRILRYLIKLKYFLFLHEALEKNVPSDGESRVPSLGLIMLKYFIFHEIKSIFCRLRIASCNL